MRGKKKREKVLDRFKKRKTGITVVATVCLFVVFLSVWDVNRKPVDHRDTTGTVFVVSGGPDPLEGGPDRNNKTSCPGFLSGLFFSIL